MRGVVWCGGSRRAEFWDVCPGSVRARRESEERKEDEEDSSFVCSLPAPFAKFCSRFVEDAQLVLRNMLERKGIETIYLSSLAVTGASHERESARRSTCLLRIFMISFLFLIPISISISISKTPLGLPTNLLISQDPSDTSITSRTTSASNATPPSTRNKFNTLITCVVSASPVFSSLSTTR